MDAFVHENFFLFSGKCEITNFNFETIQWVQPINSSYSMCVICSKLVVNAVEYIEVLRFFPFLSCFSG